MKKIILCPPFFVSNDYITKRYEHFFRLLAEEQGFEFRVVSDATKAMQAKPDVILAFIGPHFALPRCYYELVDLDPGIKLIYYRTDMHSWIDSGIASPVPLFERADVIIGPYKEGMSRFWPQYMEKFVWFPHFFFPHDTGLEFNEDTKPRALLFGAIGWVYPFREFIREEAFKDQVVGLHINASKKYPIDILPYPGCGPNASQDKIVGSQYLALLNSYTACIATSSKFDYVLGRYFEIPAVGSLLLAEECSDLAELGFVPYEDYVPITEKDIFEEVEKWAKLGVKSEIRKKGMDFVRQYHSARHRVAQLGEIVRELTGG